MTFWVRFLEISGNFHHRRSLFTTSFHYIFTTFSPHLHHIYTTIYTTWNFHNIFSLQIFTTEGRTDRDEQTPWGCTDRFSLHIYTTNLHYTFSPMNFHYEFSWHFHHTHSENSDFHHIFTTFSRHGLDLISFFHQYFTQIFTTIRIFMTFSPRP